MRITIEFDDDLLAAARKLTLAFDHFRDASTTLNAFDAIAASLILN